MCVYRESSCSQWVWAEKEDSVLRAGWDLCIKHSWQRGMNPSSVSALGSVYFGSAARARRNSREMPPVWQQIKREEYMQRIPNGRSYS